MKIYKVIWREIGFYKTDVKANSKAEAEEKIRDNLGDASHINTNYCTKIDGITVVKENIKMKPNNKTTELEAMEGLYRLNTLSDEGVTLLKELRNDKKLKEEVAK